MGGDINRHGHTRKNMTLLIYQTKLQTPFQTSHLCNWSSWLNVKSAKNTKRAAAVGLR